MRHYELHLLYTRYINHRDFNAPLTPAPRPADSSAAAVVATALLLLARSESTPAAAKPWSDAAIQVYNYTLSSRLHQFNDEWLDFEQYYRPRVASFMAKSASQWDGQYACQQYPNWYRLRYEFTISPSHW